jgi:hypothetical protein
MSEEKEKATTENVIAEEVSKETTDDAKVDEFVEATTALAKMHEQAAVAAIANGIKFKYQERLAQIQAKNKKNNNYNRGYLAALTDVYYSLKIYLGEIDAYTDTIDNNEEDIDEQATKTTD